MYMFGISQKGNGATPIDQNQVLHFQKGRVFLGKIKEILPNNYASIQIGTKVYTAKLDIALRLDHTYWFHVEQMSESGVPYLAIINKKQAKDPYEQLLEKLKLPKDILSKTLLHKLSENQLVEYEKIPTMIHWIQKVPTASKDLAIQTILFMVHNRFPMEKSVFESLLAFFKSDLISNKLILLYNHILSVEPKTQVMEDYLRWFNTLKQTAPSYPNRILSMLGIDYETFMLKNFQQYVDVKSKIQLKPILLHLVELNRHPTLTSIAKDILLWISGQQLVNYDSNDMTASFIFQIPILFQEVQHDLWVKMQGYKNASGKLNSENIKLLFYINLTYLEDTVVELTIQKNIVSIKVFNEKDISTILPVLTTGLKEGLRKNGYTLSSITSYRMNNVHTSFFTPYSIDESKVDKRV
jgi:hypothetical protein